MLALKAEKILARFKHTVRLRTTCRLNFFVEKSSVTEIWVKLAIYSWKIFSCELHTLLVLMLAHL